MDPNTNPWERAARTLMALGMIIIVMAFSIAWTSTNDITYPEHHAGQMTVIRATLSTTDQTQCGGYTAKLQSAACSRIPYKKNPAFLVPSAHTSAKQNFVRACFLGGGPIQFPRAVLRLSFDGLSRKGQAV